ncbi:MAG: MFS transporter [Acidobacteria bacterium]|nr:MFS transporter [Acidobacteriota bacterium]
MTEVPGEEAGRISFRARFSSPFLALRHRDFRLVWIGAFISTTGTWMQTIAQAWVVLSMTGSAFYLGLDAFLATLPMILFSLAGGVVADRIDRKRLLMISQVLQMSFAFILTALLVTDQVQVWHILVLSFCTGTVQAFGGPAYQALLPVLVEKREVPNAVALNSMQFNLARMLGPSLAGIALATLGAEWCFGLNGLSFVAVIITLFFVEKSFARAGGRKESVLFDLREGLSFVWNEGRLFLLTVLAAATTLFGIPIVTMMPVVAENIFGVGASGYSWLMTASGAGSVTGAVLVASILTIRRRGSLAIGFQLSFALLLLAFAFSRMFWLSAVLAFLTGLALLGVITVTSSMVQLVTTEQMRGRVMSIFMLAFRGGMPLGNLFSGWATERWNVTFTLAFNAIALLGVGLIFLAFRARLDSKAEAEAVVAEVA